jgi:phospholipid/cholesterol/gamma-HCH transport system permease protein
MDGKRDALNDSLNDDGGKLHINQMEGSLVLALSGDWKLGTPLPSPTLVARSVGEGRIPGQVLFDASRLGAWDSGLLTFLVEVFDTCSKSKVVVSKEGLPTGVQRLIDLALAVPEAKEARRETAKLPLLARLGDRAERAGSSMFKVVTFVGDVAVSLFRMISGRARFRSCDLWLVLEESGSQALPIVSLISLLVGLILAFVGSIQLKVFGAQIYVADLVGVAMVRAMGAIMAGIIMAGRTGASFAAQIGTMQVNEEIDALKTSAIPPIDFLVLPRVVALAVMMPLLTLYADLMGILGGLVVGVTGLHLDVIQYYNETRRAVTLTNVWIGLFSGFVFGIVIALAGCLKGIQCGRSASAVGDATRSAVVTSIVGIVVATAIITVVCDVLGI